jgi:hypothetical protein
VPRLAYPRAAHPQFLEIQEMGTRVDENIAFALILGSKFLNFREKHANPGLGVPTWGAACRRASGVPTCKWRSTTCERRGPAAALA